MVGRIVELVEHDPSWASQYAVHARQIRESLWVAGAPSEVVDIAHVGSTAVPGLVAKPIVDVVVGLREWPASPTCLEAMAAVGYRHHGELGMAGRHFLTDAPMGADRTVHVHAVEHGSWFWREHLRFRDHLRAHPEQAASYGQLKQQLAIAHRDDRDAYTDAKTTFIHQRLREARGGLATDHIADVAVTGFDRAADAYERGRPDYPTAAIAHLVDQLGLGQGSRLLEVGAGTGKMTRLLAAPGRAILASEPLTGMRRHLEGLSLPGVEVVEGVAEEIDLPAGSVDAVVVAQAFHWFDPWAAFSEFHRVLRPGGRVALVWNVRDEDADWVAKWTALIQPVSGDTPRERFGTWRRAALATSTFTDPATTTFPYGHTLPRESMVDRVGSISFVASLPDQEREPLLEQFRSLLDEHPATAGTPEITMPYRTEVHILERVE